MMICFELFMPGRNSWNGRWSGEDRVYARIVNLGRTKKARVKGEAIIQGGAYSYAWSDGWCARVVVREVDAAEANRIRKRSAGFCGYDWMIDSIRYHGEIRAT